MLSSRVHAWFISSSPADNNTKSPADNNTKFARLRRLDSLGFLLHHLSRVTSMRPLDHLLGDICELSHSRGGPRALYFNPPLATHLGDSVVASTKPLQHTVASSETSKPLSKLNSVSAH